MYVCLTDGRRLVQAGRGTALPALTVLLIGVIHEVSRGEQEGGGGRRGGEREVLQQDCGKASRSGASDERTRLVSEAAGKVLLG
jgi:hypothetical protein